MEGREVIALLPLDERTDGARETPALVRLADGRMAVENLGKQPAGNLARFRRSAPILDPDTREVIGYEMVQVLVATA